MTQVSTTAPKPDSVMFGELAIAAGLAGKPVFVCFSESAASIDCELWRYFAQFAGPDRVLHVNSQADVNKLKKNMGSWRLVVVHTPRLFNAVAWTVQAYGSATAARPAVFSRFVPAEADDVPMPLLVLRGTLDESTTIICWLMAGCPQQAVLPSEPPVGGLAIDPALVRVTMPRNLPAGRGPARLGDCQLLAALLCGARLLDGSAGDAPEALTCGPQEYERVRLLLQLPLVGATVEAVDQLAVDMVNRANVFLKLMCDPQFYYSHQDLCGPSDSIYRRCGSHTRQELVSRREVADLGNVCCKLIRAIVEWLGDRSDGHDQFCRMGLIRQAPGKSAFRKADLGKLTAMLRPWSHKQTRTHFDALRRTGLITGERESGNGPWQYRLPEELCFAPSQFAELPTVEELCGNV